MQAPDTLNVHTVSRDDMGHRSYQPYEIGPRRFSPPVECEIYRKREIRSLSRFMEVVSGLLSDDSNFWFRGQEDAKWPLTPYALRFSTSDERKRALSLLDEFIRVAEIRIPRPPPRKDKLQWSQLARHYGLPTRLLDWTESATFALYFACAPTQHNKKETDGVVYLMNPDHLLIPWRKNKSMSYGSPDYEEWILKCINSGPEQRTRGGMPTVPIRPVWNSERLMMQRGVFTLHGSKHFSLDSNQAKSLVAIPILKTYKSTILSELSRIGVDEMTLFPELDHACNNLVRSASLM